MKHKWKEIMKKTIMSAALAVSLSVVSPAFAAEQVESTKNAQEQLQKWVDAIKARDAAKIVALYDDQAVLLSTFDPKPIVDQTARLAYFEGLTKKDALSVKLNENFYEENGDIAIANGTYTFSYKDEAGKTVEVPARYSFVFENEADEGWEIESHHSSLLPKK